MTKEQELKKLAYKSIGVLNSYYHKEKHILSFSDIYFYVCNVLYQKPLIKKNRDKFYKYIKVELELVLQTPVKRHFIADEGYAKYVPKEQNWFYRRSFCW